MCDFFSSLKEMGISQIGLSITYDKNLVSVSLLPKSESNDKSLKKLKALTISLPVNDMDERFFEIINEPLEKTKVGFNNVEAYEKSLQDKLSKTESGKKQKESVSKDVKSLQEFVGKNGFNPLKDHKTAIEMAEKILAVNPNQKDAKKVIKDMSAYTEPSLF